MLLADEWVFANSCQGDKVGADGLLVDSDVVRGIGNCSSTNGLVDWFTSSKFSLQISVGCANSSAFNRQKRLRSSNFPKCRGLKGPIISSS